MEAFRLRYHGDSHVIHGARRVASVTVRQTEASLGRQLSNDGAVSRELSVDSGRYLIRVVRSKMTTQRLILFGLILFAIGCDNTQRGLYSVSSHGSVALTPECSQIELVCGSRNTQEAMGNDHLLLSVIAFSPGFQSSSNAGQSSSGTFVTSIRRENIGPDGSFNYNVVWNRADETIVFGSRQFVRTKGNVFFLLDDGSPEHLVLQIPGIVEDQSVDSILQHARRSLVDSGNL